MRLGRWIAYLFLLLALVAVGWEAVELIGGNSWRAITLGEIWFSVDSGSLNLVQAVVQRYLLPELWDPVITWILLQRGWAVFAVPGIVLLLIFRRRR